MKTASRLRGFHLLVVATAAALAACGDDTTTPEATGSVDAGLTDGALATLTAAGPAGVQAVAELAGSMSGSAQVSVYSDAEGWVELGDPRSVTVALQSGEDATVVEAAPVPSGTYTRVRLLLSGFHADLEVGSIIDGATHLTAVSVTMGGSDNLVVIETDIPPLTIQAQAAASVTFDLNSSTWVTPQAAQTEMADDADIQAATTATAAAT
jgi:hypothetical protein